MGPLTASGCYLWGILLVSGSVLVEKASFNGCRLRRVGSLETEEPGRMKRGSLQGRVGPGGCKGELGSTCVSCGLGQPTEHGSICHNVFRSLPVPWSLTAEPTERHQQWWGAGLPGC